MIGQPYNDAGCMGAITQVAADLVAAQDPLLLEIASQHATTEALAGWIRSLPQRDDLGRPGDGPKVHACVPSQRLRLPAVDPNCVERAALYVAAAELIDPGPVRQLATLDTPIGAPRPEVVFRQPDRRSFFGAPRPEVVFRGTPTGGRFSLLGPEVVGRPASATAEEPGEWVAGNRTARVAYRRRRSRATVEGGSVRRARGNGRS